MDRRWAISPTEDIYCVWCAACRTYRALGEDCEGCGADLLDAAALVGIGTALKARLVEVLRSVPERVDLVVALPCLHPDCDSPSLLLDAVRGGKEKRRGKVGYDYDFGARCRNGHRYDTGPPGLFQFLRPRKPK